MDELGHDERLRRLQRLAYGAVASDAERAAAVAEIEALRREREQAHEASTSDGDREGPRAPADAAAIPDPVSELASSSAGAGEAPAPNRYRWAITIGATALVVGVAVGWQAGLRMHELSVDHHVSVGTPDVRLVTDTLMSVPIEAAPATAVFDRDRVPGDAPVGFDHEHLADDSFRLLSTRSDGVRIYAARTADAANVCVVITLPTLETPSEGVVPGGAGSACTDDGLFPGQGITQALSGQGRGTISVSWRLDGSVSVSPADSVVPPGPDALG